MKTSEEKPYRQPSIREFVMEGNNMMSLSDIEDSEEKTNENPEEIEESARRRFNWTNF